MTMHAARFLLAAALLAAPAVVSARGDAEEHAVCKDDFVKYCGDIIPGEGRLMECMVGHSTDLSPACKEHISGKPHPWWRSWNDFARTDGRGVLDKACGPDIAAVCKDVKPGEGRVNDCLKGSKAISQGCKDFLALKKPKKAAKAKKAADDNSAP